jgi:hypothetical protein
MQMIDDRAVRRLLEYIAVQVIGEMRDGKTLAEIDGRLGLKLRKKDRIVLFEYMAEQYPPELRSDPLATWGEEGNAIVAHLRTLKRRKRPPQPTHPPATVIPFRPEDRPDL